MDKPESPLEKVLLEARSLSSLDKIRLIEQLSAAVKHDLSEQNMPRKSLYGIWSGVDVTAEDVDSARDDMWRNFPREDL